MKLKHTLLVLSALLGVTIATSSAGDPSVKTKKEKTAAKLKAKPEEAIPGAAAQPSAYFYTGKPYDEDLGGYVFNYRTYSPGMSCWTTPDPSGFPDGANSQKYAPCPTNALDFLGAWKIQLVTNVKNGGVVATNSGTVDTGWWDGAQQINSSSAMYTNITADFSGASGSINAIASGNIERDKNWHAKASPNFSISVDGSGTISISPSGSGGWQNTDHDLQIASTYTIFQNAGEHKASINFATASIYEGTGLTGAGVAGASLSWSGGKGKVDAYTTLEFKAVE